jgi:phospholipase C
MTLNLSNAGTAACHVTILHRYTQQTETVTVPASGTDRRPWLLERTSGWYDLVVRVDADIHFHRHIAGHVETGNDSVSDLAIGKA